MTDRKTSRGRAEEGSGNWYLFRAGDFVKTVALAIQRADLPNKERLRLAYPQMLAAFEAKNWDKPPEGWVPEYNAPGPEAGAEYHASAVMRSLRRVLKQGARLGCDFCFAGFRAITLTDAHEEQAEQDRKNVYE